MKKAKNRVFGPKKKVFFLSGKGGYPPSRFPCCVLSYFSLVFVMEHMEVTNPSHKSQLSRAINYKVPSCSIVFLIIMC